MRIRAASGVSLNDAVLALGDGPFSFVTAHANCFADTVLRKAHGLPDFIHGSTSCLGAMTDTGKTDGVAVFAIEDAQGAYGTGMASFDTGPRAAATAATQNALRQADRLGEQPELVWVSATPGTEEEIVQGIEDVTGSDIPIIGGSAADNSVSGDWYVFDGKGRETEGVIVSVLFPSRPISFAYQSGYSPTDKTGRVTSVDGRTLKEIDGKPAMDVYAEWTGYEVPLVPKGSGPEAILSASTLWPLGREINQLGQVPFFLLAHPAVAHESGEMEMFATVEEGEEITLMHGTKQSLVERAGRVASLARETGRLNEGPIAGALMIYCGGCMLSVQDSIPEVVNGVNTALGSAPFLGAFTFGEQGTLIKAGNRHGNLMISCIVFG
ncbi:FIST N-terminal domain-containing protein [Cognatiyoonia sp. IB215446]|uniref:FIST signal transduction protein n=1 Tax=Cognatiyoonia sp. IB215446 TaxID=3097355 RepID=UPI002A159CBF|nr:FIST N-terminal domain-containing protein [Cognatiyoonia sp. IB215446]MDX8346897.1 FIST N-terminal domain-containing protein [Cognatiyoonia sp. IB215446]